jgi:hypothetical protein
MAGLPKEELLEGLLLISAPSGVIGVRKQVSDCTLRDFCFWLNVLNYPIISQPKLQIFRQILKQGHHHANYVDATGYSESYAEFACKRLCYKSGKIWWLSLYL